MNNTTKECVSCPYLEIVSGGGICHNNKHCDPIPKSTTFFCHWGLDKDVNDFRKIADNLRAEGFTSRADAVEYLIERIICLEEKLKLKGVT